LKKRTRTFVDSLVVCMFPSATMLASRIDYLVEMLNLVNGWQYTDGDALTTGMRIDNLLRAFNIRHGLTPELEAPSSRYGSAQVDGPAMAGSVVPHWDTMLDQYYKGMGWDKASGRPLPETLRRLGLDDVVRDLWQDEG
jgi:aldehyde:ferredoxin oxidoreductase